MSFSVLSRTILLTLVFSAFSLNQVSAQSRNNTAEKTWASTVKGKAVSVPPKNTRLLALQISKLERDTFGHGKPPFGNGFVSSWLVGSGTGVQGYFEIDREGEMLFQEDASSLKSFADDRGTDLKKNPTDKEINDFFDENKLVSVKLSPDQRQAIFTLRGYSTPKPGATKLTAKATLAFLSFSAEKTATQKIDKFAVGAEIEIGPVKFAIEKATNDSTVRAGRTRNPGFGKPREWALTMQPRSKPVKLIELLDAKGNILNKIQGLSFDGQSHTQLLEKMDGEPKSIRVTWYEKWERIEIPIEIETTLGI